MMKKDFNISAAKFRKSAFPNLNTAIDYATSMALYNQYAILVPDMLIAPFDAIFRYSNNPFNIRDNNSFLGYWKPDNGFSTFKSLLYGVRAFVKLMKTYYILYDLTSVNSIIKRYAPSSENDTASYARLVSSQCESEDVFSDRRNFVKFAVAVLHMEQCIPSIPSVVVAYIIYYLLYYYDEFFKKQGDF